jgi:hypothetical protein
MKLERFAWKTIIALLVGLLIGVLLLVFGKRDSFLHDVGAILSNGSICTNVEKHTSNTT